MDLSRSKFEIYTTVTFYIYCSLDNEQWISHDSERRSVREFFREAPFFAHNTHLLASKHLLPPTAAPFGIIHTHTHTPTYWEHNTTRLRSFLTLMHIQCVAFNPYQESDSSKSRICAHFSNNLSLLVPHKMRQCKWLGNNGGRNNERVNKTNTGLAGLLAAGGTVLCFAGANNNAPKFLTTCICFHITQTFRVLITLFQYLVRFTCFYQKSLFDSQKDFT